MLAETEYQRIFNLTERNKTTFIFSIFHFGRQTKIKYLIFIFFTTEENVKENENNVKEETIQWLALWIPILLAAHQHDQ